MSITDELRRYINGPAKCGISHICEKSIANIADRIDEAHKHAIAYVDDRDQETMAENGWVKLPVDADGEYIHIGDVMEVINGGLQAEACYMQIGPSGIWSVGLTKNCHWYDTESLRHHHTPTVEDVLREMCVEIDRRCERGSINYDELFAEYAKRLRLAEEE